MTEAEAVAAGIPSHGDCSQVAFHAVYEAFKRDDDTLTLCHGQVTGTDGPVKGVRFFHAWVEQELRFPGSEARFVLAIDRSNGSDVSLPRELYYRAGKIDPDEVARYTPKEAIVAALNAEHYGPWEDQ